MNACNCKIEINKNYHFYKINHRVENVTILFSDFVGFTQWSNKVSPHVLYEAFDRIALKHKIYKVETSYMAVSGCPEKNQYHADECVKMALEMIRITPKILETYE